jgi:hypothetical protein
MARFFPTRSGKLVDIDQTREDADGLYAWATNYDRRDRQYYAVRVFIPNN